MLDRPPKEFASEQNDACHCQPSVNPDGDEARTKHNYGRDHREIVRAGIAADSAAIPRPHTAASTSKAAAITLALADEPQAFPDDIPAALARLEPDQVALGKYLHQRGSQTGDYLLFQRPQIATVG
jgi:hypothetical protein